MGDLCHCIVSCAHLENDTGHKTATMVAPLVLISGPGKYEAGLHSNFKVFLCAWKGMYAGDGLD